MYGDVFNLDGWAGAPMTAEHYHHKIGVLERHCENVGRDPVEIRKTILMPALLSDDKDAVNAFMTGRGLGAGTAAGTRSYIVDRVGEIIETGVDEIMFGGILTDERRGNPNCAEIIRGRRFTH